MTRYLILHNAPVHAKEYMANFTSEQVKAGMQEWMDWKTEAEKTIKFEWGLPLQPVALIAPDEVKDIDSEVSGYSIMEADNKDLVIEQLKKHPHLKRPGATIEVFEMLPVPEMKYD